MSEVVAVAIGAYLIVREWRRYRRGTSAYQAMEKLAARLWWMEKGTDDGRIRITAQGWRK